MKTIITSLTALGLVLSLGVVSMPEALAKAHDQGSTDNPGQNVQSETVGPAQGLGAVRGNSGNTPAAEKSNRGDKSNNAGGKGNAGGGAAASGAGSEK